MAPVQPYHGAKLLAELQQRLKLYKYPEWAQLKQYEKGTSRSLFKAVALDS